MEAASASSGAASGERLERACDPRQQVLRRAVRFVEEGVTRGGGGANLLGAPQPIRLAGQLVVFTRPGIGGRQLVALELEQGPLALPRRGRIEQRLPLAPQCLVGLSRLAVGANPAVEPTVGVEQLALLVRVEQGAPFELAVDVDQSLAQLLERGDGDRQSIDLGAAASLRRRVAG